MTKQAAAALAAWQKSLEQKRYTTAGHTVIELVRKTGLAETTIRRHVKSLTHAGLAKCIGTRKSSGGSPEKAYLIDKTVLATLR